MSILFPWTRADQYSSNATGRFTATYGTLVTGASTAHVLSPAFTDIIASTAHDAFWVEICIHATRTAATRTDALLNIYKGASGAEQVLIPNLLAGWSNDLAFGDTSPRFYGFPLYIPSGTRLSAKGQALQVNKAMYVWMRLWGGGQPNSWAGEAVECVGAVPATSTGTTVVPGAASEGVFTPIGTNTFEWNYILPMIQGGLTDTSFADNYDNWDIGSVSATFRDLADFCFGTSSTQESSYPVFGSRTGVFTRIPAATPLQMRAQNANTGDASIDAVLYGVY